MISVSVELFGIPHQRAGVALTTAEGGRLGEVLTDLASRFPSLAGACFAQGRLQPGYLANLNGNRFVTDPETAIRIGRQRPPVNRPKWNFAGSLQRRPGDQALELGLAALFLVDAIEH